MQASLDKNSTSINSTFGALELMMGIYTDFGARGPNVCERNLNF
jgi:hypothetical protein